MKTKLLTILCIIALVFGIVAVGCAGDETPPAEQEEEEEEEEEEEQVFNLTFSVWDPPEIPMMRVVQFSWAKWLEDASDGRIKITFLMSETAAKSSEQHDACATGLVDMCWAAPGMIPQRYRVSEITTLPLLFKFPGSLTSTLTMYELYDKYSEYFEEEWEGVKIWAYHNNSPSHVNTIDKQVKVIEDLKGQILNCQTPGLGDALGFTPEVVSAMEGYDALAKGVMDGTIHEYEGHYVWNHYEICNYTTEVGINVMGQFTHLMNIDVWNSLPADLQALFEGENGRMVGYINGYNFDRDDGRFKDVIYEYRLAHGNPDGVYVLPDAERARWVDAIMPMRDAWIADAEDRGAPARDMLDDTIMWSDEFHQSGDDLCPWCYDWFLEWYGEEYAEIGQE